MSRGRPFEPGNTLGRGRPPGSKNKSTSPGWGLLKEHAESLFRKIIAEGLKGNSRLLQWCVNELRRAPPRTVKLKLPPIKTHEDIALGVDFILNAVLNHKLPAAEGQALTAILAEKAKMIETQKLPSLEHLENLVKKDGSK
jgi:hypothetical protein